MGEEQGTSVSDQEQVARMEVRRMAATRIGCLYFVTYLIVAWAMLLLLPKVMPLLSVKALIVTVTVVFIYLAYRWDQSSAQHGIVFALSLAVALGTAAAALLV